jgi:hypothetical protein
LVFCSACFPSANSSIIFLLKAGMSSGLRLEEVAREPHEVLVGPHRVRVSDAARDQQPVVVGRVDLLGGLVGLPDVWRVETWQPPGR